MDQFEEIKVALIQSPLSWENPGENRAYFTEKLNTIETDSDIVILPEMFTSGFTMSPENLKPSEADKTLLWMKEQARDFGWAITGSMIWPVGTNFYNRLWFVKPDGSCSYYDKRHTFTLAGEDKVYGSGQKRLLENYKGFKFCPLICYDLRFPVWSRNTEDYDVLLYVANWPKPRTPAWDVLLKARAIENMAYCIGVNRVGKDFNGHEYVGHSAVYDSLGERLAYSDEETVLYAVLSRKHLSETRNKLKFLEDRDLYTIL